MRVSNRSFGVPGGIAAIAATWLALVALCGCGASGNNWEDAGTPSGSGSGGSSGSGSGVVNLGDARPGGGDGGGFCLTCYDATVPVVDAGSDAPVIIGPMPAIGTRTAPDCVGCTFPDLTAPSCAASAPAIKIVYPNDTVLLPPNLNELSIQWTPFGPPFTRYEVDFSQPLQDPKTDYRIITACKTQTLDMQPYTANGTSNPTPSGGCELALDPPAWSAIVGANRGLSNPIVITVRGTTDGTCASSSSAIHMSIAEEDLLGTYYYWQSTITSGQGIGGFIWAKVFGDLNMNEVNVTPNPQTLNATCNGCHSLSRDGSRMVVYSDDNDSDDEYSDIAGSELDMTPLFMGNPTEFPGGITQGGHGGGGQPPGFTAINPQASSYVTSNGYPCATAGGACGAAVGYPTAVPLNGWSLWNATNGTFVGGVPIGAAGTRPTMPDWSIDGTTLVYVQPAGDFKTIAPTPTNWRDDDAHIFGGSLYTVPYTGMGTFGTPTAILTSSGENNYYPSYSPDNPMSFIIFNRVAGAGGGATCTTGTMPMCQNDSFSNPAARLWLMQAPSATNPTPAPIDLKNANGSTDPWSNSYPRWAPFVQNYHGNKLLWFTFSSTRDYGVRVLNHKTGMYQCYPSDSAENSFNSTVKAHGQPFDPAGTCQEPQLWMAPLTFTEAQQATMDPSGVAFWLPYQKMTTHNHTAQWTWTPNPPPPPIPNMPPVCSCSQQNGMCGASNGGCGCCMGLGLVCTGSGFCIKPPG